MKTTTILAFLGLLLGIPNGAYAHERGGDPITVSGKVNVPIVPSTGGIVYLQVSVVTPSMHRPYRKPMNVSIVLDRSGSMADERKIHFAKSALFSLVDQLSHDDLLSIVVYDDVVDVLRPSRRVGHDRREIRRLVEEIYPRGSTNLGGGMIAGLKQAKKHASKEYVNRVILLSDGLANQGITDPGQLRKIARSYRMEHTISLTTMGVGLDYNENLMVGLAEYGGGNYYFIESPHSIAHILHHEFNALTTIVAQNSILELSLGGNAALKDVIGYTWKNVNGRYQIDLGDLYASQTQEITLEVQLPEGSGQLTLARGSLQYTTDASVSASSPSFETGIQYSEDLAAVEQNRDLATQARADVAVSTRAVEEAMTALDNGDEDAAMGQLQKAAEALSASPAAGAASGGAFIEAQERNLEMFQKTLKDSSGNGRRAKKAIQYDNYRTQKNHQ